jgi:hypothetical protein
MPANSKATAATKTAGLPARRREFRNCLLVEQPNGNYADTMMRQFFFDTWHYFLMRGLLNRATAHRRDRGKVAQGSDLPPAPQRRPGRAPGRRHRRQPRQDAGRADELWIYSGEVFIYDEVDQAMVARASRPAAEDLRAAFLEHVAEVFDRSDADDAAADAWMQRGGKQGATPSTSATSWPRCSSCSAPIPESSGNEPRRERDGRTGLGLARRGPDPEIPVISVVDLGIVRDVAFRRRRMRGHDHPDLFRLPGDAGHRRGRDRPCMRMAWSEGAHRHPPVARLDHRLDERGRQGRPERATASRRRCSR